MGMFNNMRRVWRNRILKRSRKVGIALGGGGVRGLAHVGVLSVLEQEKIPIDYLAGSSMGAIVAAAYTLNPEYSGNRMIQLLREFDEAIPAHLKESSAEPSSFLSKLRQFINIERFILDTISGWSVLPEDMAKEALERLTMDKRIEEASIPIAIVTVDLLSGEKVVFREGPAAIALQASSAIPAFFPPVPYKNMLLVDGAIVDVVPADVARDMGSDIVLGVDVGQTGPREEINNGLEAFLRAVELSGEYNKRHFLRQADLVIKPDFGETIVTFDTSKAELCIEAGIKAARQALPKIRKLVG